MPGPLSSAGLILPDAGPDPATGEPVSHLTEEAAIIPCHGEELRVEPLVSEGALVAQGQPVLRLRDMSGIAFCAPMASRVARIELNPGRRLGQVVLFREPTGARHLFETAGAEQDAAALRVLMQASGLWRMLRRRPFGHMPAMDEIPAAIFVSAIDTRPGAPDPARALTGREEAFGRGLSALSLLAPDGLFLCEPAGASCGVELPEGATRLRARAVHPQGLVGLAIHRHRPADTERPVWAIHAEDVADLGDLIATSMLPETRLVSIGGAALREARLVRCQPGADLRGLSQSLVKPGPHEILSGSLLDGRPAHWLGTRDRQVTVAPRQQAPSKGHWFGAALARASHNAPIIPTAALTQALGGGLPAAAFVRTLASGDVEAFARLGGLSLLEEDVALADYVTGARPRFATQLRALLDRIETEEGGA